LAVAAAVPARFSFNRFFSMDIQSFRKAKDFGLQRQACYDKGISLTEKDADENGYDCLFETF
jgi:hypothetical protein